MNTRLFRQVSLDRLSSPDELDQILRITGPRQWIALTAVFAVLATAIVWGFTGSITTSATGRGVIVRRGGVLNVVARGNGLVLSLNVKVGDKVTANQVVAGVGQPVLAEKVKAMRQAREEASLERARVLNVRNSSVKLQLDALDRQRANTERQIGELEDQHKLATEQVAAEEQLLAKGLVTKQQAIAAKQKRVDIEDQIAHLHAQIKQFEAQKFGLESQPAQEDAAARDRISVMDRELTELEKELVMAQSVVSPYAGEVLELKVSPGGTVIQGQPILSIQPDAENLELIAYLPSMEAKDARTGMEAQISPATIKREEFGFMKGKIVYVSDYPATPASLMRNFENESLVTALTGSGPVTEIRIALEADRATVSGFRWSNSKGPPVGISSGTLCGVQIVTRRQKAIALVIPYIKEKLGLS